MILYNLKLAFRNIRRNKTFSMINIAGLAVSLASLLVISLFIWDELNHDKFHTKSDRIYRITEKQDQAGEIYNVAVTPYPLADALAAEYPEIERSARVGYWMGVLKNGDKSIEIKKMLYTENSFFGLFDFPLVKGSAASALVGQDEIIISERVAEQFFGKNWESRPNLIGSLFKLNDQDDFKLAGVVKNVPANSSFEFEVLLPLKHLVTTDPWSNKWNSNNFHTYVLLNKGSDVALFGKKISNTLSKYNKDTKDILELQPFSAQFLYSKFDFNTDWGKRSDIKYIRIFSITGILLLLIACINFINLSTARSVKKAVEVGVRKVNGASRKQLVWQFVLESLLVTVFSGLIALVMVQLVQPLVSDLAGYSIPFPESTLSFGILFAIVLGVVGLLAGLYPAVILSAYHPAAVIKMKGGVGKHAFMRKGLVVFQFAVSVTLILCTLFMYRQLSFMRSKDLGFDKEHLVEFRIPPGPLMNNVGPLKNELAAQTSIVAVSPSTMDLSDVDNSSYLEWEGMQERDKFLITHANVDPDFIPALDMKILAGSNFSSQITNDTATYIVNESTVKKMGYDNKGILGKEVIFWGNKGRIIGVVKDFHFKPLSAAIDPFILRYQPADRYFRMFLKLRKGQMEEGLKVIKRIYAKYEKVYPLEVSFVDEGVNQAYKKDGYVANIILAFSMLTIFIGCLGLFGLTVFSVEQRVREIGIRKVLGAGVMSIMQLLLKDFLKLVLIGTVLAFPVAWYASSRWLENYAYRIDIEWWVFAITGLAVMGIALATVGFQAKRSALANPVKSLRAE